MLQSDAVWLLRVTQHAINRNEMQNGLSNKYYPPYDKAGYHQPITIEQVNDQRVTSLISAL